MAYTSEEDIKTEITNAFFPKTHFVIEKNRLDFVVKDRQDNDLLWAESKKGAGRVSKWAMLAQLILTIKPRLDKGEIPPTFVGCFDADEITFVEFFNIQEILATNDFNWNERPSSVSQKSIDKVQSILDGKEFTFNWRDNPTDAKEFVKNNLHPRGLFGDQSLIAFVQITKNNFVQIFNRWSKDVLPSIMFPQQLRDAGIIDGDFFLADLLSDKNKTISKKLKVLLNKDQYEINISADLFNRINFRDNGKAHKKFWAYYVRPPKEEYRDYIASRRDLLVPSGIRERKGAYFTPQIWVQKSQEYIAQAFGNDWQDEYYVWDCCAGTGNLLEGLSNPERIWASTLDEPDVRVMKDNKRLLESHVFQFDFLNDDFDKLPEKLYNIIKKTPEKLIIYINPPYAEVGSGMGKTKNAVNNTVIQNRYKNQFGKSMNELFVQFMARIYMEIPGCKLAQFSKLKFISAPNFHYFRNIFRADFELGFVVRANTFDNVKGNFPIGFTIWDLAKESQIVNISCDVIENDGIVSGIKKIFASAPGTMFINDWIRQYKSDNQQLGILRLGRSDFQHWRYVYLTQLPTNDAEINVNSENLMETCIYFSVNLSIPATWLNDRDQFLYPNNGWTTDAEFQDDCLIFTLFNGQNYISSRNGTNHWIPFKPSEVGASDSFASDFMSQFIKGREFSAEAKAALDAGRDVWRFYHKSIRDSYGMNVNAGLYEIRDHFRGRANGRMKSKSADAEFQAIDDKLKSAVAALAQKIAKKVYKYGFLKK